MPRPQPAGKHNLTLWEGRGPDMSGPYLAMQ